MIDDYLNQKIAVMKARFRKPNYCVKVLPGYNYDWDAIKIDLINAGIHFTQSLMKADALLVSTQAGKLEKREIRLAKVLGIPVVGWQHGAAGFYELPWMRHVEYEDVDVHFVYGRMVKERYDETARNLFPDDTTKFVVVGSARLDRMKEELRQGLGRNCTYITRQKYEGGVPEAEPSLNIQDVNMQLPAVQSAIVWSTARYEKYQMIVRAQGSRGKKEVESAVLGNKDIKMKNIRVINYLNERMPSTINKSRFLIYDHVSTGLLEGLLSNRQIFVYGGWCWHFDKIAMRLLERRAFVESDIKNLLSKISGYITTEQNPAAKLVEGIDVTNNEFLAAYGTTGNSAETAVNELLKVLGGS